MGKYLDWYEVEFERVSNRRISTQRRDEIIESLREHVAESKSEFIDESSSGDEAERLAVKNLGSPRFIVAAETDRPRLDWLPVWMGLLGMAWMVFFVCLSTDVWSIQAILPAMVATPSLVFLTSLGRKRTKYWALGGITALLGLAMILVICFGWIDMNRAGGIGYMPKWHITSVTDNDSRVIENYKEDRKLITSIWMMFQRQDAEKAKELIASENGWKVPGAGVFTGMGHTWIYIDKFEEAKKGWLKPLGTLTRPADQAIERLTANLSAMKDARSSSPSSIWTKNGYSMVGVILLTYLALAGSHFLGLFISAVPRWLVRTKWKTAL